MLSYSPSAYVVALSMRANRTLLVEGRDDKRILARLYEEVKSSSSASGSKLVIDTAEIIRGNDHTVGNREKVEFAHELASKIGAGFAAVVDREFRDFDLSNTHIVDELGAHKVVHKTLFWTRGHSIDNYFLCRENVLQVLKSIIPESLPEGYEKTLGDRFADIHRQSAAFSLAAHRTQILTRLNKCFHYGHWRTESSGNICLDLVSIATMLRERGLDDADISAFNASFDFYNGTCANSDLDTLHWVMHGHIAVRLLWAAIGKLFSVMGITGSLLDRLSHGDWETKYRVAASFWSQECARESSQRPEELLLWLRG